MRSLVILCVILYPASVARAQCLPQLYTDPKLEPDYACPGPGEDALVPTLNLKTSVILKVGEPAPWAGILMDKDRAIALGLRIQGLRRLRWQETIRCQEVLEAEKRFQQGMLRSELSLLKTQREYYKKTNGAMQKEISQLRKWYRSPFFWFSTGVAITSATAIAIAFGL